MTASSYRHPAATLDENDPAEATPPRPPPSWPWLREVMTSLTPPSSVEPIPPLHAHDHRPAIRDLIRMHRSTIDALKASLRTNPLYHPTKHDDLWLLRFVLSHKTKKLKVMRSAIETTLQFRHEHSLDDMDIRPFPVSKTLAKNPVLRRYLSCCAHDAIQYQIYPSQGQQRQQPEEDGSYQRGVIAYVRPGGLDMYQQISCIRKDEWIQHLMYVSEWTHQWLDYVTRTTGRLTKSIRIVDLEGFTLMGLSRECLSRDGQAMGQMEDCYPQLLQTLFITNTPSWLRLLWRIVKPILPKRVVSKMDVVHPMHNENDKQRLLEHLTLAELPARYGGEYPHWPVMECTTTTTDNHNRNNVSKDIMRFNDVTTTITNHHFEDIRGESNNWSLEYDRRSRSSNNSRPIQVVIDMIKGKDNVDGSLPSLRSLSSTSSSNSSSSSSNCSSIMTGGW